MVASSARSSVASSGPATAAVVPGHVPTDLPLPSGRMRDITEAALTLFAERGYLGTSMKDIAADLGLRAPSLYNHFESKQHLLSGIMLRTMMDLLNEHRTAISTTSDVVEQLRRAMEAHVRYHARNPRSARIGNAEVRNLEEPVQSTVREMRREYERAWRDLITQGVKEGRFDAPSPQLASYAMLQMGIGISMWFKADGELSESQVAYYYGDLALRLVKAKVK